MRADRTHVPLALLVLSLAAQRTALASAEAPGSLRKARKQKRNLIHIDETDFAATKEEEKFLALNEEDEAFWARELMEFSASIPTNRADECYSCRDNDPCGNGGEFYVHCDVGKYIQCSEGRVCHDMPCPEGLVWDQVKKECDYRNEEGGASSEEPSAVQNGPAPGEGVSGEFRSAGDEETTSSTTIAPPKDTTTEAGTISDSSGTTNKAPAVTTSSSSTASSTSTTPSATSTSSSTSAAASASASNPSIVAPATKQEQVAVEGLQQKTLENASSSPAAAPRGSFVVVAGTAALATALSFMF